MRHTRECAARCAPGCDVADHEAWLRSPVTRADVEADRLYEERSAALLRGEIPS